MLNAVIAMLRCCRSKQIVVVLRRLLAVVLLACLLLIAIRHQHIRGQHNDRQQEAVAVTVRPSNETTNYAVFLSLTAAGVCVAIIGLVGCYPATRNQGRSTDMLMNNTDPRKQVLLGYATKLPKQHSNKNVVQFFLVTSLVVSGIIIICGAQTVTRSTGHCPQQPPQSPQRQNDTPFNIAEFEIKPIRTPKHSASLDTAYAIPNNVIYVWCGAERQFEFRHYLGLLSVIHFMQPDNIMFYFHNAPAVDRQHYNTWLSELEDEYPFFLRIWDKSACDGQQRTSDSFVRTKLCELGGVYVGENVVIAKPLHEYRKNESAVRIFLDGSDTQLVKMSAVGCPVDDETIGVAEISTNMRCVLKDKYAQIRRRSSDVPPCVFIDRTTAPKDIWELDNSFGQLLRTVAYGKPDLARPVPDYSELIPNIGHVVWLGGGEMKLDFFLSVLSLLHVAKVDAVYIHGEAPTGVYWQLIRDNPRVKIVQRTLRNIYRSTKAFADGKAALLSDHCRVDVLLRYGGIYVDTDAIVVQPLSRELRAYEAIANVDINTARRTEYPDTISNGVMAAKLNSHFQRLFLDSMKSYDEYDYFSLGVRRPYKIKERHPETIRLEPRLQVLCFESKCRPAWGPNYRDENVNQFTNPDMLKDWKNATFAFHFTWPTPTEFQSMSQLLSATSMIGDIGRYVLEQAEMLEYFRNNRTSH